MWSPNTKASPTHCAIQVASPSFFPPTSVMQNNSHKLAFLFWRVLSGKKRTRGGHLNLDNGSQKPQSKPQFLADSMVMFPTQSTEEELNSPMSHLARSSGSCLIQPRYLHPNSDLTHCPAEPQCTSLSSSASLLSAMHQFSLFLKKIYTYISLNPGPPISRPLDYGSHPVRYFLGRRPWQCHPRDTEMEAETVAWVTYRLLSLSGCSSPRALPGPLLSLCLSLSLPPFLVCRVQGT
uniref:Uncharacterized protein n=1 Tax=Myotis myotis TaxID=51298 RepID=A0A7J7Y064_MYOMY|nr:hypothetical protein mMyoMyo1_011369 [Myotis myotis]